MGIKQATQLARFMGKSIKIIVNFDLNLKFKFKLSSTLKVEGIAKWKFIANIMKCESSRLTSQIINYIKWFNGWLNLMQSILYKHGNNIFEFVSRGGLKGVHICTHLLLLLFLWFMSHRGWKNIFLGCNLCIAKIEGANLFPFLAIFLSQKIKGKFWI
jgi:hypothetical protein